MTNRFTEIRTRQDLVHALARAKKIEEAFEEVLYWQGFLTAQDSETGRLLGALIRDSEKHEQMVDSLIRMVKHSDPPMNGGPVAPIVIDGEDELQLLRRLLEAEDTAYYVYSTIQDSLADFDVQLFGSEENAAIARSMLGQLVAAEKRHRELVVRLLASRSPP